MVDSVAGMLEGEETQEAREPPHRRNVFGNRFVSVVDSEVRLDGLGPEHDDLAELADVVAAVRRVVDLHRVHESRCRRREWRAISWNIKKLVKTRLKPVWNKVKHQLETG
jgi:hypothetical protein